jgi:hypothetical protein
MGNEMLHLSLPATPWREIVNAPSFQGDLCTRYLSLLAEATLSRKR